MKRYDGYPTPGADGAITLYNNDEALASGNFQAGSPIIFVNGMANTPKSHRQSAVELSLLQMKPVYGVFNKSDGGLKDVWQCTIDKFQFDGVRRTIEATPTGKIYRAIADYVNEQRGYRQPLTPLDIARQALSANAASLALFDALRKPEHKNTPIYAHSQGNLITSNALFAIAEVDGPQAVVGREVNSFGSPALTWPKGLKHQEYAFTGDMIALMSGFDWGFKVSKIGLHDDSEHHDSIVGTAGKILSPLLPINLEDFFSHNFLIYMKNDPEFVVNRFRWGSFGMTASMDEQGLAEALLSMGNNIPRVQRIFEHLDKHRNSDADDVAEIYVRELRKAPLKHPQTVRGLQRYPAFRKLLIKVMDEGWTSKGEYKEIEWLKGTLFV